MSLTAPQQSVAQPPPSHQPPAQRPPQSASSPRRGRRSALHTADDRHQPALDGLRAVAIAGVLALHASIWGDVPAVMPGGDLGVNVFFVLSGYLITARLLAEQRRTGTLDLRAFYLRRAARLLPALAVLLAVYAAIFSRSLSAGQLALTLGAALLYLSSIVQAGWGAMGNLGWTWSLSVEEHFYALWPLLVRALLRRHRRRSRLWPRWAARDPLAAMIALAAGAAAAATLLRIAISGSPYWNDFAYYAPITRVDALAIGCLVALLERRRPLPLAPGAGWLGLAVIAWSYQRQAFAIGGATLNDYGLSVSALAAAVVIVDVSRRPRGLLARLLSCRLLAHIGRVSYGLYVWNLMPGQTFHLLAGRHPGLLGTLACAGIVIAVVELSFWCVERPCLRWTRRRLQAARPGERERRRRRALAAGGPSCAGAL